MKYFLFTITGLLCALEMNAQTDYYVNSTYVHGTNVTYKVRITRSSSYAIEDSANILSRKPLLFRDGTTAPPLDIHIM